MGVNDESQLDISGGITLNESLKWKLIKPEINSTTRFSWDIPTERAIETSNVIAIYGVSFGITDNKWWELIRNWLLKDVKHRVVWFVRDKAKEINKLLWSVTDFNNKKSQELLVNLGFERDDPKFTKLLDQVYIIADTKRLSFKKLILKTETTKEDELAVAHGG